MTGDRKGNARGCWTAFISLTAGGTHDHDHKRSRLGDGSRPRIRLFAKFCRRQKDRVRRRVDGHGLGTRSRLEVLHDLEFAGGKTLPLGGGAFREFKVEPQSAPGVNTTQR